MPCKDTFFNHCSSFAPVYPIQQGINMAEAHLLRKRCFVCRLLLGSHELDELLQCSFLVSGLSHVWGLKVSVSQVLARNRW